MGNLGKIKIREYLTNKQGIVTGKVVTDGKSRIYRNEYIIESLPNGNIIIKQANGNGDSIEMPPEIDLTEELVAFFGLYSGDGTKGIDDAKNQGIIRVFGYKEVYFSIRRYSPVQGLCRLFLFIGFFLFRLRVSRQMDFPHEVKDNIHFLKTLAVYLLRRMDNDFLYKLIDDSGS